MPILLPQSRRLPFGLRPELLTALILLLLAPSALSQAAIAQTQFPPVTIEAAKKKAAPPKATSKAKEATTPSQTAVTNPVAPAPGDSLTVPTTARATAEIERTPGGVAVVPDTAFKNSPANTIKDVLGWVPGVVIQPRWGPDGRLSIRGSGLTRSFGNRGINMYMDGIPINTADGLFDLFEIDPSA